MLPRLAEQRLPRSAHAAAPRLSAVQNRTPPSAHEHPTATRCWSCRTTFPSPSPPRCRARPADTPAISKDDWFNIFVLHQNRVAHTQVGGRGSLLGFPFAVLLPPWPAWPDHPCSVVWRWLLLWDGALSRRAARLCRRLVQLPLALRALHAAERQQLPGSLVVHFILQQTQQRRVMFSSLSAAERQELPAGGRAGQVSGLGGVVRRL